MERTATEMPNPAGDPTARAGGGRIVRTPETCLGKPRIDGTRIKVEQVVLWHDRQGMAPVEIVARWSHLTLGDIEAALSYYRDHRDEIDGDLAEADRRFEELKAAQPSILDKARRRTGDATDDQVPSR